MRPLSKAKLRAAAKAAGVLPSGEPLLHDCLMAIGSVVEKHSDVHITEIDTLFRRALRELWPLELGRGALAGARRLRKEGV